MSNTLTVSDLTEILYQARDKVVAEPVGAMNSVLVNAGSEGVSIGGTVKSAVTAAPTLNTSVTPAMTVPAADDQTVTANELTIGQTANVRIPLVGEAVAQLAATIGWAAAYEQLLAQGIRVIRNAIEAHVLTVGYKGASRAVGTAGTTPFATSHGLIVQAHQILIDNGCPEDDGTTSLVLGTTACSNLKLLSNIYKVNEAGGDDVLRRGVITDIDGVMIKKSAQVQSHTKGAGTGYDADLAAGYAVGATTIHLDGGTVNTTGIKAGDVVTFAGDTNKYVVNTGTTEIEEDIILNKPGLRVALDDTDEMTIGDSYAANLMFHRNAIELVMRPPAEPPGGDAASAQVTLLDEVSGLVFNAAIYKGYRMNSIDITCYYQAKVWKSEFVAALLG